jgi:hypothetical protein
MKRAESLAWTEPCMTPKVVPLSKSVSVRGRIPGLLSTPNLKGKMSKFFADENRTHERTQSFDYNELASKTTDLENSNPDAYKLPTLNKSIRKSHTKRNRGSYNLITEESRSMVGSENISPIKGRGSSYEFLSKITKHETNKTMEDNAEYLESITEAKANLKKLIGNNAPLAKQLCYPRNMPKIQNHNSSVLSKG